MRLTQKTITDSPVPSSFQAVRDSCSLVQVHTSQAHQHKQVCGSPDHSHGPSAWPAPLSRSQPPSLTIVFPYSLAGPAWILLQTLTHSSPMQDHIFSFPRVYQHNRPALIQYTSLDTRPPLLTGQPSLKFSSEYRCMATSPKSGKDTDTWPAAAGMRNTGWDLQPHLCGATCCRAHIHLTYAVPPSCWFMNACCSCPSDWRLKIPTHCKSCHEDPTSSSSWHHRPRAILIWYAVHSC